MSDSELTFILVLISIDAEAVTKHLFLELYAVIHENEFFLKVESFICRLVAAKFFFEKWQVRKCKGKQTLNRNRCTV